MPQILSIQVGLPRTEGDPDSRDWATRAWTTGFFKEPVSGLVEVSNLGLVGDGQADRKNHGGVDKAILAYAAAELQAVPALADAWKRDLL